VPLLYKRLFPKKRRQLYDVISKYNSTKAFRRKASKSITKKQAILQQQNRQKQPLLEKIIAKTIVASDTPH
jgi:ribonuclease HII